MVLHRLLGQETEYAIRAAPYAGHSRPSNLPIYQTIAAAINGLVETRPGAKLGGIESVFVQNGGSFCYEFLPTDLSGGLLEGSTPECRGPSELLLFQKAQEQLLVEALATARRDLRSGHLVLAEDVGLVKNCRDARGHIYGAQENYEVPIAGGPMLWLYRAGLAALLPAVLLATLLTWLLVVVVVVVLFALVPLAILCMVLGVISKRIGAALEGSLAEDGPFFRAFFNITYVAELPISWPAATAYALLLRATAFRPFRRDALAFLASRSIVTGAGTVRDDGSFALSEKGLALELTMRATGGTHSRSIVDTGNLLKGLMAPAGLRLRPFFALFRARQRLQLGLSDSNMAQVAEYLKLGTTCLVIDMAQAGYLRDAPRLKRPVAAVHTLGGDSTLQATVPLRDGSAQTALSLQRWYLERARRFVAEAHTASLEAREVVRLWDECLTALEQDPGQLVGRVDWVTKRWLVETTTAEASQPAKKKVDIRYHELGEGYFARLEAEGLAPMLVSPEEAREAIFETPAATPARMRGRLIRELAHEQKVTVDWGSIRIGGKLGHLGARVIRLDDYR